MEFGLICNIEPKEKKTPLRYHNEYISIHTSNTQKANTGSLQKDKIKPIKYYLFLEKYESRKTVGQRLTASKK